MNKREFYGVLDDFSKAYGVTIELIEDSLNQMPELIIRDCYNRWVSRHKLQPNLRHDELDSILNMVKLKYNLEINSSIRTFTVSDLCLKQNKANLPEIKNVIFNEPATIILWADGTKTVVKCQEGEGYDPEKGMAMAISKKVLGNKGNYYETFKKWLPEKESELKSIWSSEQVSLSDIAEKFRKAGEIISNIKIDVKKEDKKDE